MAFILWSVLTKTPIPDALAINSPDPSYKPRAEHNNFKLYDSTFYNHLQNNSCPGRQPAGTDFLQFSSNSASLALWGGS